MFEPCRTCAGVRVSAISGMDDVSGNRGERGRGQRGHALGRAGGGERQRPHDDPARELDLEAVVAGRASPARAPPRRRDGTARHPPVRRPGSASASRARHGFMATPPSARRASRNRITLEAQRGRGRYDRKSVGGAFANLQVTGMGGEIGRLCRQAHRDDHLAGLQHALAVGRVARQPVKRLERDLPPPCSAFDLDDGVERDQRYAEIGWVGRDAAFAPSHDGVQPVLAAAGVAARRRDRACCRRWRRRRNRRSASAARDCRRPWRRCEAARRPPTGAPRRPRESVGQNSAIVSEVGVADQRSDAHAAVGKVLDAVEAGKTADVDQPARAADAALHQVQKIGAGGQIGGARIRSGGNGLATVAGRT